jgi:ADP-ribose pyrophosphatase YjhB (NUDIX family)
MMVETRQAALCLLLKDDSFLVAEITDSHSGNVLHRPPGGGIEKDESPEQAVRRELREELGLRLLSLLALGPVDHIWFWEGRELHERAWLFASDSAEYPCFSRGETPELLEADGQRFRTVWRPIRDVPESLPALCPSALCDVLKLLKRKMEIAIPPPQPEFPREG